LQKLAKKPEWIKVKLPTGKDYVRIRRIIKSFCLNTVCEEALCPNIADCWGSGTATIMILGDICTRACKFCSVTKGNPKGYLDVNEPERVARAVFKANLDYVVLTSVCRDDLKDGGASHFAETIKAIKKIRPKAIVEVLIPDFQGDESSLKKVVDANPNVIGHNIEVVERLSKLVRDRRASYELSLFVLEKIKELNPKIYTKSSIMVGLGETKDEVIQAMKDLRLAKVDFLTIGQYLRPSKRQMQVVRYVSPNEFKYYEQIGLSLGFLFVASGPLVRSSYKAGEYFVKSVLR
jgi:lipoic acid synthetase